MTTEPTPVELTTVTATYRRPDDTRELLQSLAASLDRFRSAAPEAALSISFVVVCPASDRETLSALESLDLPALTVLTTDSRRAADNRDRGIREAVTEYVAVVDSDCVVGEDWVERAYLAIRDSRPDVVQGGYFFDYPPERNWITRTEAMEDRYRFERGELDSRNLLFRRETYLAFGGYGAGDRYAGGGDDPVLRPRLEQIGADIETAPELKAYHKYPRTLRGNLRRYQWYGRGARYARRQYPELAREPLSLVEGVVSVSRNLGASLLGRNERRTPLQSLYLLLVTLAFFAGVFRGRLANRFGSRDGV